MYQSGYREIQKPIQKCQGDGYEEADSGKGRISEDGYDQEAEGTVEDGLQRQKRRTLGF